MSSPSQYHLVIALGNPGPRYEFTRHNIGWLLLDDFLHQRNISAPWKSKFKGEFCEVSIAGRKVFFLKPQTYMNLSGESARAFIDFYKIPLTQILVIHDELDFPLGRIALKQGGGLAGHNGLKSLCQHLGTPDFTRMRLGIDRPSHPGVSDWVLSPFSQDQEQTLGEVFTRAGEGLEVFFKDGFAKAQTLLQENKKHK